MKISIETIIHATEDVDKILNIISKEFYMDQKEFSKQSLTGHFNNPIILARVKITTDERINKILFKIISNISKYEIDYLTKNIHNKIEGTSFYLRLGKQDLINGIITLNEKDSIKIKISNSKYVKNIEKSHIEMINRLFNQSRIEKVTRDDDIKPLQSE